MVPMRRVAGIVVLVLLLVPAPALASSQAAATHTAIAADYALSRVRVGMISSTQGKVEKYNSQLAGECPNAGAGTPENEAAEPMAGEVADALWSIDYGATAGPIQRFASAIKPLRWSSAPFNHAIHMLASSLSGLSKLSLPNLCADVRSWTASGFKTVPPHVEELDQRVETLQLPEVPWKQVARYVHGKEAGMVSYIEHAELKLAEAEFMLGQRDWYQVIATVGLQP